MTIITEVWTYLSGDLVSTGREPVDVPDDLDAYLDDPTGDARDIELDPIGDMVLRIRVGCGIVQRL